MTADPLLPRHRGSGYFTEAAVPYHCGLAEAEVRSRAVPGLTLGTQRSVFAAFPLGVIVIAGDLICVKKRLCSVRQPYLPSAGYDACVSHSPSAGVHGVMSGPLMEFTSHIEGRNAKVAVYEDRIEWGRQRITLSGKRLDTNMVPIRQI